MPESDARVGGRERQSLVRPVGLFALTSAAALALTAAAVVVLLQNSSRAEAIRDARALTTTYARTLVQPALTDELLDLDPAARAAFDAAIASRLAGDDRIVRVKVWRGDGTIAYSDEPRLVGMKFELEPESLEVLQEGGAEAEIGTTDGPENVFDRSDDVVLEVYTQVKTESGKAGLFEIYVPYSRVQADSSAIWWAFAPIVVAALALVWLVQLPVAWSLARKIRDGQNERERLLQRALNASDAERRRIATDLHNGVVQTMAGAAYSLGAVENQLPADTPPGATQLLSDAAAATRASQRELRNLLVDIYPPRLREVGLDAALHDLVAPLQARGAAASVVIETEGAPSDEAAVLIYRTAQEAVHNVRDHASADRVEVRLAGGGSSWELTVDDDGVGLDDAARARLEQRTAPDESGQHMGLLLLREMATDADSSLSIGDSALGGVRVSLIMGASTRSRG
ncbi:MAG: histidine kinase [Candidatus Nanopelagicales bacterium]